MMKKWLVFASMLALALVIAACGANSDNSKETTGSVSNDSGNEASASDSEVVITAKDWEFDQKEYRIKAGETVDLTLKSAGGVHGVSILKTDYNIGNKKTVAVKFDAPGTYDMICNVPCGGGHGQMKAKLIVE
ncbi:cytochrome C oxidase subunit II [Paenibacillus sp. 1011MAR3C5]|uniref:cupredoxin domain-containing protein n=1 Tax=Paenibacillus sp. 1011MAR3C5 TaxID=1675787 RepID=UPI000E6C0E4F|nr:cupredoxin domain-containing protein [Paenibacillus sp. 1011MAR3C5]RJE91191.1 cytochrome C oxidase subunit II [Paenibacillus sp. 1011MAR3C5]